MKIMHIWDMAGVGHTISKQLNKKGHYSSVFVRKNPFGFSSENMFLLNIHVWIWRAIIILNIIRFDVIHIHGVFNIIPIIRKFYANKPIVFTYHGSKIRFKNWKSHRYWMKRINFLSVSTADLLKYTPDFAKFIPNPVDQELFYKRDISENNRAIMFNDTDKKGVQEAKKVCQKLNIEFNLLEKNYYYQEVPHIL